MVLACHGCLHLISLLCHSSANRSIETAQCFQFQCALLSICSKASSHGTACYRVNQSSRVQVPASRSRTRAFHSPQLRASLCGRTKWGGEGQRGQTCPRGRERDQLVFRPPPAPIAPPPTFHIRSPAPSRVLVWPQEMGSALCISLCIAQNTPRINVCVCVRVCVCVCVCVWMGLTRKDILCV